MVQDHNCKSSVDAFAHLSVVDLTVDDDLTLKSDSAVLGFGADTDTALTHTDGTGLTLNSTNKLCFCAWVLLYINQQMVYPV